MASLPSKTLKGAIVDEGLIQAIVTGEYDERSTCTISALRCACDIENKRDGSRPPPPPKRQRPLFLCFSTRGGVLSSELRPPFQTTSAAGGSSQVPLRGGNRRYYSCITALLKWTTALAETSEGPAEELSNIFFFFGGSSRRLPSSVRRSQSQGSNGRIAIPGREPLSTSPQAANFLILFRRQYFHNAVSILLASIRKILCGPIVEPGSLHAFA